MGCFLACFGGSSRHAIKNEKKTHLQNKYEPVLHLPPSISPEEEEQEILAATHHVSPRGQKQDHQSHDSTKESQKEEEAKKLENSEDDVKNVEWSEFIENPKTSITLVESKGKIRSRSAVMSPIENITQWNAIKSKEEEEEIHGCESILTTSLSTWLSSPPSEENDNITPMIRYNGVGNRPVLGALTLDSSSAHSTPIHRNVEIPILCNSDGVEDPSNSSSSSSFKGIPNTTSKYREDQKVKWHTTPFEMRLEKALRTEFAQA